MFLEKLVFVAIFNGVSENLFFFSFSGGGGRSSLPPRLSPSFLFSLLNRLLHHASPHAHLESLLPPLLLPQPQGQRGTQDEGAGEEGRGQGGIERGDEQPSVEVVVFVVGRGRGGRRRGGRRRGGASRLFLGLRSLSPLSWLLWLVLWFLVRARGEEEGVRGRNGRSRGGREKGRAKSLFFFSSTSSFFFPFFFFFLG